MDMEDVVWINSDNVKKKANGKGNVPIYVWIHPEQNEFLSEFSRMLGVRKGCVVMLAIEMLKNTYKEYKYLFDEALQSPYRRAEVRRLFSRFGIELRDRDFIF